METKSPRLTAAFYRRDVLTVARELLGKVLVRRFDDGSTLQLVITETEAYRGEEDLGCHASKGRTPRTEVMYWPGGFVYVYLIYGMYWMLNVVAGPEDEPQAVLIRGTAQVTGPGRIGKILQLDASFYGEDLLVSSRLFITGGQHQKPAFRTAPRIGIDYAGKEWSQKPWRFIMKTV